MYFSGKKRRNKLKFKKLYSSAGDNSKNNLSYSDLKTKTRTRFLKLILSILAAANIIILSVIIFLIYLNTENNITFNKKIFKADRCIKESSFNKASEILSDAVDNCTTKKNALILLKRDLTVSENLDNYSSFLNNSEHFYNIYKRDKRIKKIYLYSLLKTGSLKDFFKLFPFKNKNDDFHKDLLLEAYSKYLIKNETYNINRRFKKYTVNNPYFDLLDNKYNLNSYIKAYETDRNKDFLNNTALLLLENGRFKEALKYSEIENKQDYLQSLIYYDNRKYQKSLKILSAIKNDSRTKLIMSDLNMYLKNYSKSQHLLQEIISSNPDLSNIPLINLIWINYRNTSLIDEKLLLNLTRDFKNRNIENLLFFINLHKTGTYSVDVLFNDNSDISKLLKSSEDNINNYIDILWRFLNNYSTDNNFKNYFLYYLFQNNRYSDLKILLEKDEINKSIYNSFFRSLCDIKNNNYNSAENNMKEFHKYSNSWENIYNSALLHIRNSNYSEAVKLFSIILEQYEIDNNNLSLVYFWKAYSEYHLSLYNASLNSINKSLFSNRSNIEAKFLLNHIKSKIVES